MKKLSLIVLVGAALLFAAFNKKNPSLHNNSLNTGSSSFSTQEHNIL